MLIYLCKQIQDTIECNPGNSDVRNVEKHEITHEGKREENHNQVKGGAISSGVDKTKAKAQQTQKETEKYMEENGEKKGKNKAENEEQKRKPGDNGEKANEESSKTQQKIGKDEIEKGQVNVKKKDEENVTEEEVKLLKKKQEKEKSWENDKVSL